MLSNEKIEAEIMYNKYDIFKRLFSWYMYAGTLLFVLLIIQIFPNRWLPGNGAFQVDLLQQVICLVHSLSIQQQVIIQ